MCRRRIKPEEIANMLREPDVLIIVDKGMKQLPKGSGEYLFKIIMRHHENRPIEEFNSQAIVAQLDDSNCRRKMLGSLSGIHMAKISHYVKVGESVELLGISKDMLRRRDHAPKLQARPHSIPGFPRIHSL